MPFLRTAAAMLFASALTFPAAAQDCDARRAAVSAHAATFSELLAGAQSIIDTISALVAEQSISPAAAARLMQEGSIPMTSAVLASQARLEAEYAELTATCPD